MHKDQKKKLLISLTAGALVLALGVGIFFGISRNQGDPIPVITFADVGMTEYWGDNMESHGPVSSDNIQTVYLSDTQTVTEVLVKEGDTVKKGDPMMTFDTTLSGLDLERKRLEVEKLKLELLDQEAELRKIMGLRPMQTPPPMPEPGTPDLGDKVTESSRVMGKFGFDGSSQNAPLICWLKEGTAVDQRLVDTILELSLGLQMNGGTRQISSPSANGEDGGSLQTDEKITTQGGDSGTPVPQVPEENTPPQENTDSKPPKEDSEGNQNENQSGNDNETRFPSRDGWKLGVVSADQLDIHAEHDLTSQVVQTLGKGTSVCVFERWEAADQTPWAFVEVMGASGWVLRDGLEIQGEEAQKPDKPVDPEEKPEVPDIPETPGPVEPEPPKVVTVHFNITPPDAQVTMTRASNTTVLEKIGSRTFHASAGVYYYTVQAENHEAVLKQRLEIGENDLEVQVALRPYRDISKLNSCYVVFKSTKDDMTRGERTLWQGMKLYQDGSFRLFDAALIPDFTMTADLGEEDSAPDFDLGSGMTAAQIAELRQEQEKKIEATKLNVKMAEADYKIKKRELEDGNIYAEFDGKVVSLLSEEESRDRKKPMIKVSGGGGYQVEGSVNELDRETMQIGQEVTVNDWNSGESYQGKVIAIGEFPVRTRGYSGRGNPNSSYYPFTVFVDGEANLQTGSYVSIQYASGSGESGIYLSNPFLREEKGKSYVYVMNDKNRLEKRTVTTGKALWGSYTEITSGLTADDYLAFPYGKNVKPGAKAKIGDMSDFYG